MRGPRRPAVGARSRQEGDRDPGRAPRARDQRPRRPGPLRRRRPPQEHGHGPGLRPPGPRRRRRPRLRDRVGTAAVGRVCKPAPTTTSLHRSSIMASASISTRISGAMRRLTSTMLVAGLILPKNSPWAIADLLPVLDVDDVDPGPHHVRRGRPRRPAAPP